jgi:hypothetical protein
MKSAAIVTIPGDEARLRRKIRSHFKLLGFTKGPDGALVPPGLDKQTYRDMHAHQREAKLATNKEWIDRHAGKLIQHFASGAELNVEKIRPRLEVVYADTWQSDLFRLATYYWRIPISDGYGRRMRFLVWDDFHEKLIGIFALGDAVFNLKARDEFIGWDHHRRTEALINLMDAYALGAVPPYNMLLGGKLIASLIQTREVANAFQAKYQDSVGIISGERKNARLVAVTTTSALGRSSIYNRLRIGEASVFQSIGYTSGWGHFHISDALFEDFRKYLESIGDDYAGAHSYGQGPNFRLRVVRKVLAKLGMDPDLARHGLAREVFFCPLATNAIKVLRGEHKKARYAGLPTVEHRANTALSRWVLPRSGRMPEFRDWQQMDLLREIASDRESGTGLRVNKVG